MIYKGYNDIDKWYNIYKGLLVSPEGSLRTPRPPLVSGSPPAGSSGGSGPSAETGGPGTHYTLLYIMRQGVLEHIIHYYTL